MNHQDKRNIVEENKINLFIDDSIMICKELENIGVKTFIMNLRVNEKTDVGKMTRVNSWNEIYSKIEDGLVHFK